jgi:type IV pilus assembly protein PilW
MNTNGQIRSQRGFTLVEMMVAVVIMGLVLMAIYQSFISQFRSYTAQDNVSAVQVDVRTAADMIARDIRNAGFAVQTGTNPVDLAVNGGAGSDSIRLNLASSTATYLVDPVMTGQVIKVQSAVGFEVGQLVDIIDLRTKLSIHPTGQTISAIDMNANPNTLTITGTPTAALMNGDIVVSPPAGQVTYALTGTTLTRTTTGPGVELSQNIQSVKFNYLMADGSTVTVPADYTQVSAVQVTLTGVTNLQVAQVGGTQPARTLQTVVGIRNRGF